LLVILLLLAGGAAYYHFGMKKAAAPAKTTKTTQAATQTVAPVTIKTKHYDSSTFLLGLDYPEDWELSDTDAKLTITSPGMTLKDITGKNVSARVQVMIRSRQTTVPEFATGPGTAVLESEKISYQKPTQNQRAQTYVSFVSYASDKLNGLDALYVAGDNGYQSGQSIPMTDVLQTDPLINVNFLNCDTDCAKTTTALSLSPSDWKSETLAKPITTILTSLTLN